MATFTEQEAAEAFGVELEATAPESGQEPLEGQGTQGDGQGTESGTQGAEEAGNGGNPPEQQSGAGAEAPAAQQPEENGGATPEMSPEERHRQAAARRAREEQARQQAEQARVDKIYADMFAGQVSPYTGKPILTEADFREYQAERDRRQQAAQLEKAGIDPTTIQGIVDQRLKPLQDRLQRAELSAVQEKARAVNQRAQEAIKASLKNIGAMDPSVKSLADIAAMPTAPKFNELVQKGIGLEDAFYLANRQSIDAKRAAAAKAAALNGAASRRHLDPVPAGSGKAPVEVPADQAEMFREMMPEATDEEIRKAYAGFMKNMGK